MGVVANGNDAILCDVVTECAQSLFAHYGQELDHAAGLERTVHSFVAAGVIGFTGRGATGTVMLGTTADLLWSCCPIKGAEQDWVAELINQLLGRMKNQLLRYGLELYSTVPLVLRGEWLVKVGANDGPQPYVLRNNVGAACVWCDWKLAAGVQLAANADVSNLLEGEAIMF